MMLEKAFQKFHLRNRDSEDEQSRSPTSEREETQSTQESSRSDSSKASELDASLICRQENSYLFKLPSEIRAQIYREVMTNYCFHIIRKGKKLAYLPCRAGCGSSHIGNACWGLQNHDDGNFATPMLSSKQSNQRHPSTTSQYGVDKHNSVLSLPLTCKLVHAETITLLYSDNMFAFRDPQSIFKQFCSSTPIHQRAQIRQLHIEMMHVERGQLCNESYKPIWPSRKDYRHTLSGFDSLVQHYNFWKSVKSLSGLKTLEVRVVSWDRDFCSKQQFLHSLRSFRDLERYDVVLPPDFLSEVNAEREPFRLLFRAYADSRHACHRSENGMYNKNLDLVAKMVSNKPDSDSDADLVRSR